MKAATRPVLGNLSKFPMLAQAVKSPRDLQTVENSLTLLRNGIAAGEIANPRFNDAKFYLARAVEVCWQHWAEKAWPENSHQDIWWKHFPRHIGLSDIQRLPKKMNVIRKIGVTDKMVLKAIELGDRVAEELMPISDAFAWLKPRCVKIKRGKTPIPEEEMLPEATLAARKLVSDVMSAALESVRSEFLAYLTKSFQEQAKTYGDEILWKDRRVLDFVDQQLISAAFDGNTETNNVLYRRRRDANARLAKYAERLVNSIVEMFLTKNVQKIAAIVELKGSENAEITLKQASVEGRVLVTAMDFSFADGSSFEARNNIVYQTSGHGTPYVRYPTTFHNVIMPNGEPMKSPSEEEMKTVFVANAEESASSPKM